MREALKKALAQARNLNKNKESVKPGAEGFDLELAEIGVREISEMMIPHLRGMQLPPETSVIVESENWELVITLKEKQ
jgi:hypothetical protein